jgi:polyhydroxyalkanoate synthase
VNFPFPDGWFPAAGRSQDALASIQQDFMQDWQALSEQAAQGHLTELKDRRFSGDAWKNSPSHLMMAHLYLLSCEAMQRMVDAVEVAPDIKDRLHFSVQQWVDAMSPANFFATNPDAQQAVIRSGGDTLRHGMSNLLNDMQKGRITMSDESKFTLGENIATTEGSVVFENPFFQLIQYTPKTATVYQRPILLVPPCINKFYILDLQPENSFVQHALEQGLSVFMMSWRNPLEQDDDGMERATWDDYLEQGVLKALEVTQSISKQKKVNALGFCVGGTLLATALALAAGRGQYPVESLTMLTSMIDFRDPGALGVFVDESHAALREQQMGQGGLMPARELSATFSFLRPNELVWNYVVSNYLKGETPVAFDLLYWNGDGTNLPGPFFTWYFRHAYLENKLCQAGQVKCAGVPIDYGNINLPTYLYASRQDHIVPWHSAYASTHLLSGDHQFVLGASGHIAGVINPPEKKKRSYWTGPVGSPPVDAQQWLATATEHPGSWWPHWYDWLATFSGKKIKATKVAGNAQYPVLQAAPGSYVKVRAI